MQRLSRKLTLLSSVLLASVVGAYSAGAETLPKPDRGGVPESKLYDYGVMGPPATPEIVAAADAAVTKPMKAGPVSASWTSVAENYHSPAWFQDAKFGIFMHWGIYSAAAHHNEWYEKHMYGADADWHAAHFGPQEKVGYKDLIPLFAADKWKPEDWAILFKKSGARFVIPTAQHHDNFALWDSQVTPFNAVQMGPHRDLIGELSVAVRKQGLKFGVSNHGVENFTFVNPKPELDTRLKAAGVDLYDPKWASFYNVADRSPKAMEGFLTDWVNRNLELIDKYQPDILWFDNGANLRVLDPLKLHIAAYYYNSAKAWGKDVSISTKFVAYAPSNDDAKQIGSILDFEKVGTRSPKDIRSGPWMVDDTIGSTWGYTDGMTVSGPNAIIAKLADTVAKGGTYLLNISPMADGTIPQAQQDTLLGIGQWLSINGEAIYGTRPWLVFGEGQGDKGVSGIRYTTKGDILYAIVLNAASSDLVLTSVTKSGLSGTVKNVQVLGTSVPIAFEQGAEGLRITLPPQKAGTYAPVLKITGFKLH